MKAGLMDRRIQIQSKTISQNDSGEEVEVWANMASTPDGMVWAELRYNAGRESFSADQRIGVTPATFRIRWSDELKGTTSEYRLIYDGRIYEIVDVREIGRREGIEIDALTRNEVQVDNA